MRLICPSCGACCSAEAWGNDAKAREVLAAIAAMEQPTLVVRYLGLFRPASRGLAWDRAGRAVADLRGLLGAAELAWKGGRPLPVRPGLWFSAMEIVVEKEAAGKLVRPLKDHNFLKAVAYDLAAKQDGQAEKEREEKLRYRADEGRDRRGGPCARPDSGQPPDLETMGANARALLQKLRGAK